MDFSPVRENQLVSGAKDLCVKMWDVNQIINDIKNPVNQFSVPEQVTVWNVKYTPFGEGLVTLSYDPDNPRMSQNLMLWSASPHSKNETPKHRFFGNINGIQEFAWRNVNPLVDRNEHQLVTWDRECVLALWPIGAKIRQMCEEEPNEKIIADNEEVDKTLKKASIHTNGAGAFPNEDSLGETDESSQQDSERRGSVVPGKSKFSMN